MRRPSPLVSIFLVVLVDILGLTLVLPLLPFYAEKFGANPKSVGLLVSIYAFCQLIAGPALGQLSDRIGRRPVLLISQLGTFGGFILLALSRQLWMIFLARAIDGLTAGNITVAQAYISDHTEGAERTRAFGLIAVAFGLGFLVGPAISGVLATWDMTYPIWAASGLSALSIFSTYFLLREQPRPSGNEHAPRPREHRLKTYRRLLSNPWLAFCFMLFFLFTFAFSNLVSGLSLFVERRFTWHGAPFGAREAGLAFAYTGLVGVLIQTLAMKSLIRRFGEKKLVPMGFVSMMLGFALLAVAQPIWLLLLALTFTSFGASVLRPSLQSLITHSTSPRERGTVLGFSQSLQSVSQIVAPMISGQLIGRGWLSAWALLGSVIAATAGWVARPRARKLVSS
jgi:MFS transporter, DHA1 family, tetracycline resistance protein